MSKIITASVIVFFISCSDSSENAVAKSAQVITLTKNISAGSGGLEVDSKGTIYVADFGLSLSGAPGTKVYKVSPEGSVSVFASGLNGATGNAIDSKGIFYQSNLRGNSISKIDSVGNVTTFVSGLSAPIGIAIDANDNLFVANCGNNTISKITPAGITSVFATSDLFSCPNGITIDSLQNLYVSNFNDGKVLKITPVGTVSLLATIPGSNNAHLSIFKDHIYVAGRAANKIFKVTFTGDVSVFAGSGLRGIKDGNLLDSRFSLPNDIVFSKDGKYAYVVDVVNLTGEDIISPIVIRRITL